MKIKKQITDKLRRKANSLGLEFCIKSISFKGLNKIELNGFELYRTHSIDQYLRSEKIKTMISFWNLFRLKFVFTVNIEELSINFKEIYNSSMSLCNVCLLVNYRKGLLLSEIEVEKAHFFLQIDSNKDNIEIYFKADNQSWNDLISPLRDFFITPMLNRSYSNGKVSMHAYLKCFKNKRIPFFNANIEASDLVIYGEKEQHNFIENIRYPELKNLLVSKVLNGNSDAYIGLNYFPEILIKVLIATEDPGFNNHKGVDPAFVGLAIKENIDKKKISRGASTITMQVIRNLFLIHDRTFVRKIEECILSLLLENYFKITKNIIIELYMNLIEFAPGVYGVNHAAQFYFDKKPAELSITEILVLTYIIPRPLHFYEALLTHSCQLKNNLYKHINNFAQVLLVKRIITVNDYINISYKIFFTDSLGILNLDKVIDSWHNKELIQKNINSLKGLHPNLCKIIKTVINNISVPFIITEGVRSTERQQELYAQGRSTPGKVVTNCDGVVNKSNHQVKDDGYGYALDLYPFINGQIRIHEPYVPEILQIIADHIKKRGTDLNININWGGEWEMKDYSHFEYVYFHDTAPL